MTCSNVVRCLVAVLTLAAGSVFAQSWPGRPVRILIGVPPGTASDLVARSLVDGLQARWGQSVIVENRPGANGFIAAEALAKSAPDGTTLMLHAAGVLTFNPALYAKLPYDVDRDFAPVTQIGTTGIWVIAAPGNPAIDWKDFVAKNKGRRVTYATAGGTIGLPYVSSVLLREATGLDLVYVPYKGAPQAMTDLMGGQIDLIFDAVASSIAQVRNGKVKPLVAMGPTPPRMMPNLPTIAAQGYPQSEGVAWQGLTTRAGTPPEVLTKIAADVAAVMKEPAVRERLEGMSYEITGPTPEAFRALVAAERAKWTKVIRDNNIKAE
jgi:tripartite-type tricarboxylate transporter receptor subunit TctC